LITIGPIDNQSKGGDFDRRRKLRDESCRFLSVIFWAGGGIVSFLKVSKNHISFDMQAFNRE